MKFFKQIKIGNCLLIVCPFFILSTAYCQYTPDDINRSFNQHHQSSIQEKIFVHTDKSFYVAGEIVWFKLYIVNASTNAPLELSKVAYVEILDSANKHLLQAKILLTNAEGNGSFYLPVNLNSGNFKFRAYTNWMKNFSPDYFFEKKITIVNIQKRIELTALKNVNKPDIQFFPEGGNMVNNMLCKIAFKGTDQFGKSINFEGFVIDNNDTLLSFKPQHAGMGFFSFTPLSNHSYKALIQTDSRQKIITELPPTYNSGYVMNLSDSAGKILVTVQSNILSAKEIFLFAHTREIIKVAEHGILQNGKAIFLFDNEKLGDGISHITILMIGKK